MPRLVHPDTGLEFHAREQAVPTWLRSGWALADETPPGQGAAEAASKTSSKKQPAETQAATSPQES